MFKILKNKIMYLYNWITGQYRLSLFELECKNKVISFALKGGKLYITPKNWYNLKYSKETKELYNEFLKEGGKIKFV